MNSPRPKSLLLPSRVIPGRLLSAGLLLASLLGAPPLDARARAQHTSAHIAAANYTIESSPANLKVTETAAGKVVFDAAADARTAWSSYVEKSNGAPMQAQFTYRLLSVTGSILSVEEGIYCDCDGAHPTAIKQFRSIDLEHPGSAASLTAVFPEAAIASALAADPAVSKALGNSAASDSAHANSAHAESLDQLRKRLADITLKEKDCDYSFPDDLLSRFAVFDLQGANAAVRLSLPAAAQVCRGEMIQIGISLPVPEARLAAFTQAKRNGLLMKDMSRRRAVQASIQFSQGSKPTQ